MNTINALIHTTHEISQLVEILVLFKRCHHSDPDISKIEHDRVLELLQHLIRDKVAMFLVALEQERRSENVTH